ncbi:MAG: hypothetical protein KAT68_10780 [Bacteroidales bacterium]|nr:hypothetical protein [Bacteroidales bacterium]
MYYNIKKLKEKYISSVIKLNQRTYNSFYFTLPSPLQYKAQWFWDSCFHSIIYTELNDFEFAKNEIRSLIEGQRLYGTGVIPHMIMWEDSEIYKHLWGNRNTSFLTQPPMIAYAVEEIFKKTNDIDFIEEVFNSLDNHYFTINQERANDSILSIIHPWESGLDDIASFDCVYGYNDPTQNELNKKKEEIIKEYINTNLNIKKFLEKNIFNVKCLSFNSIYLRNLHSMHNLAKTIKSEKKIYYYNLIKQVENSYNNNFFNHNTGLYSSYYYDTNGKKIFVEDFENIQIFFPLFARAIKEKKIVLNLLNSYLLNTNKFWTKYPVPTLSLSSNKYDPSAYWRGSTWINTNWIIYKGLIDYGFFDIAELLKTKTFSLIQKSGFNEFFNSKSGAQGRDDIRKCNKNFTWSGLIFNMNNTNINY